MRNATKRHGPRAGLTPALRPRLRPPRVREEVLIKDCSFVLADDLLPSTRPSKELVSGYKKVAPDSEEDLMSALAEQPVSIDVSTYGWLTYSGGIYTGCSSTPGTGHAVLAVGYTTEYWKIKNSWASSWGEDGYIRLARGLGPGGHGMCNLLSEAVYPVLKSASPVAV